MEHRLRRKQLNSDTTASDTTYLKEIQEKEKKTLFLEKIRKEKEKYQRKKQKKTFFIRNKKKKKKKKRKIKKRRTRSKKKNKQKEEKRRNKRKRDPKGVPPETERHFFIRNVKSQEKS